MSQISKQKIMLFNGAAAMLIVGSFGYALKTSLIADAVPPCSERYPRGMQMALENGGQPLTSADIQARALGSDWGLLDRTKVIKIADGPAKVAIEYAVTNQKARDRDQAEGREGAGFVWAPRAVQSVQAACLAYAMFVPDGFDFGAGGRLPGFMGEARPKATGEQEQGQTPEPSQVPPPQFLTMPNWDSQGRLGPAVLFGKADASNGWNSFGAFEMPRGRWVQLEQEVVMNTEATSDGIVRTWVDGQLKVDAKAYFDEKLPVSLTGVLSEVTANGAPADPKAKHQVVSITPLIIYVK